MCGLLAVNGFSSSLTGFVICVLFSDMCDSDRSAPVGGAEHGPHRVCERGRPEEVHQCEGIDQLPLLQRGDLQYLITTFSLSCSLFVCLKKYIIRITLTKYYH